MRYGDPIEKPKWVSDMGGYNSLPKPIRESDIHEFLHLYAHATPQGEFRQVMGEDCKFLGGKYTYVPVKVFWFHDCAFVMTLPQDWSMKDGKIFYSDLPRYFRVGCEHHWVGLNAKEAAAEGYTHYGRCYHVEKCSECGMINCYDSSD